MWSRYAMEYYSALKGGEVLAHAAVCMDLGDVMPGEVGQSQEDKDYVISFMCGI